ncbi:Hypothetical protein NTJ_03427 [Nesidiocoris tenuis]|uniref:Secreted protein n=1 Tax=Nesidiocoris tenuis TaxID=355587 RepID=A0ABN7AGX8_9HEMI|nr:Hypothetical protein NTJ_03427 [Nesidiocoris tenuis]
MASWKIGAVLGGVCVVRALPCNGTAGGSLKSEANYEGKPCGEGGKGEKRLLRAEHGTKIAKDCQGSERATLRTSTDAADVCKRRTGAGKIEIDMGW